MKRRTFIQAPLAAAAGWLGLRRPEARVPAEAIDSPNDSVQQMSETLKRVTQPAKPWKWNWTVTELDHGTREWTTSKEDVSPSIMDALYGLPSNSEMFCGVPPGCLHVTGCEATFRIEHGEVDVNVSMLEVACSSRKNGAALLHETYPIWPRASFCEIFPGEHNIVEVQRIVMRAPGRTGGLP